MLAPLLASAALASTTGYYRQPQVHGDTLVFVAEGDLWRVGVAGGTAARLTTHPAAESSPRISPDGQQVAFTAAYEGAPEVWVMPLEGGRPERLTWTGLAAEPVGWTQDGRVIVSSERGNGLPDPRLFLIHPVTRETEEVPLHPAANGSYAPDGALWFTRQPFQGSHTRSYRGGTAQQLWRWRPGAPAAELVSGDWDGTNRDPVVQDGRVWFLSDRDGAMNVWSMDLAGGDLKQVTHATDLEVRSASVQGGRLAYRLGADIHVVDLATGADLLVPIALDSDFDQTRESWVTGPFGWLTAAHLAPDGSKVVLTARGQAFVAPTGQGRLVALAEPGVRYRDARFLPSGEVLALSDASGEVELWRMPANGVGDRTRVTTDGAVLRWQAVPSPDGKWIAHTDKDQHLWLTEVGSAVTTQLAESRIDSFGDLAWSADGRWLAYTEPAANLARVVKLYDTATGARLDASTDRASTYAPSFSQDGRWLYVLTDRHLDSVVDSPWSPLWSEPFFDAPTVVMAIALQPGQISPFAPADELHPEPVVGEPEDEKQRKREKRKAPAGTTEVVGEGLAARLIGVPLPPGNLGGLQVGTDRLFYLSSDSRTGRVDLVSVTIAREDVAPKVIAEGVSGFELSADRRKLLITRGDGLFVVDATWEGGDLGASAVDLSGWTFSVSPREEWRQMFDEAWRLERDYFYDRDMHGVDWVAIRDRYRPLVDRVTDRAELSDLVAQMVSELSALHTFVFGGVSRPADTYVYPAGLGADLARDEAAGGWRVVHVLASDPDRPEFASPLTRMGAEVREGEVITHVDGVPTLSVPDLGALLRGKGDRQVLLHVRAAAPTGKGRKAVVAERDVVVVPLQPWVEQDRRYHEWEWTRRQVVEAQGESKLGYVHLRAMGGGDMAEWMRAYLPVFTREGLIVDVRHNGGGNIDSWILGRLMRKPWMYWSQRVGESPSWNPQYSFRGHLVVLVDEFTASDGEAFAEGFRRLGLGPVIGKRTWGGEIWLSMSNALVDGGVASAGEYGVYGPEGTWLIEGRGVEPDVVVDNEPAATWRGEDAQLQAAIAYLQKKLAEEPIETPAVPPHPKVGRPPR